MNHASTKPVEKILNDKEAIEVPKKIIAIIEEYDDIDKLEWLMNKYNVEKIGLRPDRDFKVKGEGC